MSSEDASTDKTQQQDHRLEPQLHVRLKLRESRHRLQPVKPVFEKRGRTAHGSLAGRFLGSQQAFSVCAPLSSTLSFLSLSSLFHFAHFNAFILTHLCFFFVPLITHSLLPISSEIPTSSSLQFLIFRPLHCASFQGNRITLHLLLCCNVAPFSAFVCLFGELRAISPFEWVLSLSVSLNEPLIAILLLSFLGFYLL